MKKLIGSIVLLSCIFAGAYAQTSHVVNLTKADFLTKVFNYEKNPKKWVYEGKIPCIIDFYADWCGPCKRVAPVLADLSVKYKDKIIIYKINTDVERELAQVFGISSIPTILFVPVDTVPQAVFGAIGKEDFENVIKDVLLKK
ncbi:MAG: thioredoxin [Dysgonamonadaceae bacterium]|jgi:thioredoxin|nr:thioredoxin [Dysgonamonadaceae bacterium]